MRTTLTLDDDVAAAVEKVRKRLGLSRREAVNRLLRMGLATADSPPKPTPYRTEPQALGLRPGIDPTRLNQFADELEITGASTKLGRS